jgi:exodeoxyribonuclease VIII
MTSTLIGLYRGLEADKYHADPAVSNSMLSAMDKSPAHCWALYLDPNRPERKATPSMLAGTLAHTAILEPEQFGARYIVKPDGMSFASKEGKAWRDAVEPGVQIIDGDQHATALAQREAVMAHPLLRELLDLPTLDAEVSCFWVDEATGLRCKARPDALKKAGSRSVIAADVKTTADMTLPGIERAIATWGYHRQDAHYTNALQACGMRVEQFVFAFVSASYPFIAAAVVLDDETRAQGADEVAELLGRFAECKKTNHWPAFGYGANVIGLPRWAKRSQEVEISFVE